jgi:hypothetical protein
MKDHDAVTETYIQIGYAQRATRGAIARFIRR